MPHIIGIDARKLDDFGIGTYIQNLIKGLAELDGDNQYVLFVGRRHRELLGELPDSFRLAIERAPVYSVRELMVLSWRLFRLKLDLYHATHYVLPAVVPCRAVVTIHDIIHLLYPQFLPGPLAFAYARRMIRRSLYKADRILADSHNTRTDLMDYYGVDGANIEVVYPGVSERFRHRLPEEDLTERLAALGVARPYVLFVGNPKPHKNLDRIVRAYARSLELRSHDHRLVCVGDRGSKDFKIRGRAQQLGIEERIHLLGYVDDDDLRALYQGADLFLYPTLYEGFGLPVVEAMASGTPVVTSSSSALKEIAEGHAELVDPLDVEQIAAAVSRCLGDSEYRRRLAETGRKRSRDFRWRVTARKTLKVYTEVLTEPWLMPS